MLMKALLAATFLLISIPSFAQTLPLPRAVFDPLYVPAGGDAWGGSPEVKVCPTDTTGGYTIFLKDFVLPPDLTAKKFELIIRHAIDDVFEKNPRLSNWYWHHRNPKFDKHGFIPKGILLDDSDIIPPATTVKVPQ